MLEGEILTELREDGWREEACECRGGDGISIGGLDVELWKLEAPRKKEKWREAMQRTMKQ